MNIKLDAALRDFDGQALKADLTIQDLVNVLNKVIAAATEENKELGTRLNAIAEKDIGDKKDFTLRSVIYLLARSNLPDLSTGESETLFEVAVAAVAVDELELKAQQVAVLQKMVSKVFKSPLVQRQAVLLFDGKNPFAVA